MTLPWTIRIAACAALFALSACASAGQQPERTFKPNEVQVIEPPGQQDKWTYAPNELKVTQGTTVTFVNHGKEFHTVTSDDAGRPFDLSLDTNKTGTITFDKVGTFTYHCGLHPEMKGLVQVCDGACG
ncbi:MAG: cupredoxin domain-containing protein [Candidatus Limnocylindria bacterium]|nr:cupredoxin domain-containing protein [Candidatus Limnocylindria bacterium]